VHHTGIGEIGVKHLSKCANLWHLRLEDNAKVNDACIKYLLNLKQLRELSLQSTNVSFNGLKALKQLNLVKLTVSEDTCEKKDQPVLQSLAAHVVVRPRSRVVDKGTQRLYAPLH
jgi:hypothetical protein